jgi:hypothetical protein
MNATNSNNANTPSSPTLSNRTNDSKTSSSTEASDTSGSTTTANPSAADPSATAVNDEPAKRNDDYVFPDSNRRYLTESEIHALSAWDRYIARNEIYARRGRGFKNQDLHDYFASKSWYTARYSPEEFDSMASPLNQYEKSNAELLLSIEKQEGSPYLK